MVNFPFYKQETNYTCGAASMRIALKTCGIKKSEKQLVKLLGTNKVRGTWHKDFSKLAEKYKLNYVAKRNSSIEDLKEFQRKGYTIIICYYYPSEKVDHYSILKNIDNRHIYFFDPFFGAKHKYTLKYFNKIWKSDPKYDNERCWFFALKS